MEKKLSIIVIIITILLLTACEAMQTPMGYNDDFYKLENRGFVGGNIAAGGLMAGDGNGKVYYRSESDGWKLYKANIDGTEKVLLSDDVPCHINVLDGWVYYANYLDNFSLFRIRTDGTEHQKLLEGYCSNLYVADSGLYFDKRDKNNIPQIYHMSLDGGDLKLLVENMRVASYYRGVIYCNAVNTLFAYDLQTGELSEICEKYTHNVSVDETGVYYWSVDENTFCLIDNNGGEETVLLTGGDYFNYDKGKLFYKYYSENYEYECIYCFDVNTKIQEVVLALSDQYFDLHGNLLGITIAQLRNGLVELDESLINEQDGAFNGFSEQASYTYIVQDQAFNRGALRESILRTGKLDCWIMYDQNGGIVWD